MLASAVVQAGGPAAGRVDRLGQRLAVDQDGEHRLSRRSGKRNEGLAFGAEPGLLHQVTSASSASSGQSASSRSVRSGWACRRGCRVIVPHESLPSLGGRVTRRIRCSPAVSSSVVVGHWRMHLGEMPADLVAAVPSEEGRAHGQPGQPGGGTVDDGEVLGEGTAPPGPSRRHSRGKTPQASAHLGPGSRLQVLHSSPCRI